MPENIRKDTEYEFNDPKDAYSEVKIEHDFNKPEEANLGEEKDFN